MGKEFQPSPRERALQLSKRKDAIEAEMEAVLSQLTANNGPGLDARLVDAEGFPRADIDVMAVRTLRNRFSVLKTDLATVSADMERALHLALARRDAPDDDDNTATTTGSSALRHAPNGTPAAAPAAGGGAEARRPPLPNSAGVVTPTQAGHPQSTPAAPTNTTTTTTTPTQPSQPSPTTTTSTTTTESPLMPATASDSPAASPPQRRRPAFAVVDVVFPASPAAAAGLRVDDRLIAFGPVSLAAFATPRDALARLPALLREHNGRPVDVVIERGDAPAVHNMNIALTPRRWGGQGLLGCHVVPIHAPQVDPVYQPDVATAAAVRNRTTSSLR